MFEAEKAVSAKAVYTRLEIAKSTFYEWLENCRLEFAKLRPEDVLPLVSYFIARESARMGRRVSCPISLVKLLGSGSIRGCQSEIVAMQKQAQTNLVHLL
ncbi:MAG: hypothetical protein ACJ74Q_12970 [Pyrinomonadaceae bacterium]